MYKLHSMIFTMHWSRKMILNGTFVCSNCPNLGGNFRHREAVFDPLAIFLEIHPIYCSCWSQTSTLYYVLVSINNYVAYYQLEHKYSDSSTISGIISDQLWPDVIILFYMIPCHNFFHGHIRPYYNRFVAVYHILRVGRIN